MNAEYSNIYIGKTRQIFPNCENDVSLSILQKSNDIKIHSPLEKQYSNILNALLEIQNFQSTISKRDSILQSKKFPRYLIQSEVIDYLGKEWIFRKLSDEWGLKPIHNKHKGKLYCSKHVEDICIQFENNLKL